MSILSALFEAVPIFVSNFHFVVIGVAVGMALGTIPGMGGSVTLAILIPLSIHLPAESAFMLYGAALGATTFSGSITAIVLNTPGTASNVATLLDGYPLAKQGRAKEAIGAAAAASALGAMIGLFTPTTLLGPISASMTTIPIPKTLRSPTVASRRPHYGRRSDQPSATPSRDRIESQGQIPR